MSVEKAIKSAIEYERKMKDMYVDAAKQADSIQAKRFFKMLANDEESHLQYLHAKLKEWTQNGEITFSALVSAIPSIDAIRKSLKECKTHIARDKNAVVEEDLEVLQKIHKAEAEASNFYKETVERLKEKDRPMFQQFQKIEDGHERYIVAQIQSLISNGIWLLPSED